MSFTIQAINLNYGTMHLINHRLHLCGFEQYLKILYFEVANTDAPDLQSAEDPNEG